MDYGLPKDDVFVGAFTSNPASLVTQKFTNVICGYEKINLPKGDKQEIKRYVEDGEYEVELADKFDSTGGSDCPIVTIGLFSDVEGS